MHGTECETRGFQAGKIKEKGKFVAKSTDDGLPAELDFFKYAQGGSSGHGKRKADEDTIQALKKIRIQDDDSDDDNVNEGQEASSSSMPRQRVTAKGNNVPDPVDSFEALRTRYNVSSRLLSNLEDSGYKQPTGIQAHGVPILLEVRSMKNVP